MRNNETFLLKDEAKRLKMKTFDSFIGFYHGSVELFNMKMGLTHL